MSERGLAALAANNARRDVEKRQAFYKSAPATVRILIYLALTAMGAVGGLIAGLVVHFAWS